MIGQPLEEYASELLMKTMPFLDAKDEAQAQVIAEIMEFMEIINEYPLDSEELLQ